MQQSATAMHPLASQSTSASLAVSVASASSGVSTATSSSSSSSSSSGSSIASGAAPAARNAAAASPPSVASSSGADTTAAVRGGIPMYVPPGLTKADLLAPLPALADVPASVRGEAFLHKLRLGSILFDWPGEGQPDPDALAREAKHRLLLDLVESIGKCELPCDEQILAEVMRLASTNIFRALAPIPVEQAAGEGEEEPLPKDPAWPHLHVVYEFFLRFIVNAQIDARVLKRHINGPFVLRLLELFDSQDHRERDYLKTLLHRIYAKFMSLRAFIRKAMNNVFYAFMYDTEQFNGIGEMLEILGSIINGFALPLKQEHRFFFTRVLMPMHKVRPLIGFHQQLTYCVTQFVEKDSTLAVPLIHCILRFWPAPCSSKEVLFLSEIEEILELTPVEEFHKIVYVLFRQIAKCITSPHFQVAERALYIWQNNYVGTLISEHRAVILPLVYAALRRNEDHWNETCASLARSVLNIFADLDSALLARCAAELEEQKRIGALNAERRGNAWRQIEAATKDQVAKYPGPAPLDASATLPP